MNVKLLYYLAANCACTFAKAVVNSPLWFYHEWAFLVTQSKLVWEIKLERAKGTPY